jgi:hypothetical chaperone protein
MRNTAYGIDFGTTNTSAAYIDKNNKVKMIPLDDLAKDPFVLRTIIYISKKGNFSFGEKAVRDYSEDVIKAKAVKKQIVRTGNMIKVTSDASAGSGYKPDKIVEQVFESEETNTGRLLQGIKSLLGNKSLQKLNIFGKVYSIEELVGIFLKEVKTRADKHTGMNATKVVLGRPVQFVGRDQDLAKKELLRAAKYAGFKEVKLQLEPIGAAYDFGVDIKQDTTLLVFDFGGGTLDLSVVKFPEREIMVNTGIALGGDLINSNIFMNEISYFFGRSETFGINSKENPESLYMKLKNWYSITLLKSEAFAKSLDELNYNSSNPQAIEDLRSLIFDNLGFGLYEEIDRAKKELSEEEIVEFSFDTTSSQINKTIYKSEFEKIIASDLERIDRLIDSSLQQANIKEGDMDMIAATGGSSLIPAVRRLLAERFGKHKLKDKDSFTSVASGLALNAKEIFF